MRARHLLLVAAVHDVEEDVRRERDGLDRPALLPRGVGEPAADVGRVVAADLQEWGGFFQIDLVFDVGQRLVGHGPELLADEEGVAAVREGVDRVLTAADDDLTRAGGRHERVVVTRVTAQPYRARHVEWKLALAHRTAELLAARLGLHEDIGHAPRALGDPRGEQFDEQRTVHEHLGGIAGLGHRVRADRHDLPRDRHQLLELPALGPVGLDRGPLLLVERAAGHVVDPQLGLVGADLLDQARPFPGNARIGVLAVEIGDLQVVPRGHGQFALPLGLSGHGEHGSQEDAGVILRLDRLDRRGLAIAGPDREGHAVGLVGGVHVGVVDEHLHGVAHLEPAHRDVLGQALAANLLELHERGGDLRVGERCGEEPLLGRPGRGDNGRVVVGHGDPVARDDLQHVVLGEIEKALRRRQHLRAGRIGERDRVDGRGVGLVVGDQQPHHAGPQILREGDVEPAVVIRSRDRRRGQGDGRRDLRVRGRVEELGGHGGGVGRLGGVEQQLEPEPGVAVGVGIDVDAVHALGQHAGDCQG